MEHLSPSVRLIIGFGYLGSSVAKLWVGEGSKVFGTTRKVSRFEEIRALGVEPVLWDVLEPNRNRLPAAQTVLYCVGQDRAVGLPIRELYVEGLRQTLERLPVPEKLLYISSTGVYGDAGGAWLDESSLTEPIDSSGQACLEAERTLWEITRDRKISTVVLRLAGLYGPGRMIRAENLKSGRSIAADPEVYLNLIHVSDAAGVVEAARLRGRAGKTYLVSDGHPVLRQDFYDCLARMLQTNAPRFDTEKARRTRGNRRISNRLMIRELQPKLTFPDYRAGLRNCYAETTESQKD